MIGWFKRLLRSAPLWEPKSTFEERAIVCDVLDRNAGVRSPDARDVDEIALSARVYVRAVRSHNEGDVSPRDAILVERQFWKTLCDAVGEVDGVRISASPSIAQEISRRFLEREASDG